MHHDAVYENVHHDVVHDTIHHPAVEEDRIVCTTCGAMFANPVDFTNHSKESIRNGNIDKRGGYYTTSVVVQEAWDESVLRDAAWDEEVVAYKCARCGVTK